MFLKYKDSNSGNSILINHRHVSYMSVRGGVTCLHMVDGNNIYVRQSPETVSEDLTFASQNHPDK